MSKLIILLFFGIGFVIFTIIKSASKGITSAHRAVNQELENQPGPSADQVAQGVVHRSRKWQDVGKGIAQNCFVNGLNKGETVRHSQIQELIQERHPYQAQAVEQGFLDQMESFIQRGEVVNFSTEGGDTVFVLRDNAINEEPENQPGPSVDQVAQGIVQRSRKWQDVGKGIAQDCFDNGLNKGEIVRHSQIQELIQERHPYQAQAVEDGFLDQMKSFIQGGEVVNFSTEGGDIVFVHRDHAKDLLNG